MGMWWWWFVCVCVGGGLPFPVSQAKAARLNGAKIYEKVSVEGLEVSKGLGRAQCTSLRTSAGTIKAGVVVNAAGLWARVRQLWQYFLDFGYFEVGVREWAYVGAGCCLLLSALKIGRCRADLTCL